MTKAQWENKVIRECLFILAVDAVTCLSGVFLVCAAAYGCGWILAKVLP